MPTFEEEQVFTIDLYEMSDDRCILCYDVLIELYKRVMNETSQEMFIVDKKNLLVYTIN